LTQYDSVRLFIERAKMARSSFALTESNAGAIAQICYQLDGIPLAIELAAARLKLLSAEQIVTRLDDRFRLLTGGGRTIYPRHQTMQATIDWSYELLTQAEQVLMCRLSVFAGGWTVEAAEMVGAGNGIEAGDVLDVLQRLVDKSLAIAEHHGNQPRFRMLETIRRYANYILLASDDSDRVRTCHLNFYLQLAEESSPKLFGSEQAMWINQLEAEYPNLRAALEWSDVSGQTETGLRLAGALSYFWLLAIVYR
jgi:predicted ATPase